jgi:murein DD-endopeptidase MepM/ murein hydrolase activator NlpD
MNKWLKFLLSAAIVAALVGAYFFIRRPQFFSNSGRSAQVLRWIRSGGAFPEWAIEANTRCGDAPFQMPTRGFIGYLWGDSFRIGHQHQGIDIFGEPTVGVTPVYAAYDGYLTRRSDWKSTVVIRIPEDPLQPSRQIWTYYTHLADPQGNSLVDAAFPPGTSEVPVKAGTLLGYQGNFSGTPGQPTGVHLHFSIVQDDGQGWLRNELEIKNTLDPSPYFNLNLNDRTNQGEIPVCRE